MSNEIAVNQDDSEEEKDRPRERDSDSNDSVEKSKTEVDLLSAPKKIEGAIIHFLEDEANALIDFIDKAVKHEGLKVARLALYLQEKILNGFNRN